MSDLNPRSYSEEEARELIDSHPYWYHDIEVAPGVFTQGHRDTASVLQHLDEIGLPRDCTDMRVLDIGCRDGFFSFELEKRGAEVTGMDYVPPENTGFPIASKLLNSSVTFQVDTVYNLSPRTYGKFDLILFLGVLYHLRNPLYILDRIRALLSDGGHLFVETLMLDNFVQLEDGGQTKLEEISPELTRIPLLQFYPGKSLAKDPTNMFAPNMSALRGILTKARFSVSDTKIYHDRGYAHAVARSDDELEYLLKLEYGNVDWLD